jgi:hypothetical protein
MSNQSPPDQEPPAETARKVARSFFGVGPDAASRKHTIRQMLIGAAASLILVPLLFYMRFGEIGPLGWGTTIFFTVYCLLAAIGLYFLPRTDYHSPVPLLGDWADRIGAFWLVCCVFGPLFGWMLTSALPLTVATWRWLYGTRVFLAACLPLITALPLLRYLRGKSILIGLPLLLLVTLLPIWSVAKVSRDLWEGPTIRQVQSVDNPPETINELYLKYTDRVIQQRND